MQRPGGAIVEAACWAHARRKFSVLADIAAGARRRARGCTPQAISPTALEAVQRVDALFDIERALTGLPADLRLAARRERATPLQEWMAAQRRKLSRHKEVAGAVDWPCTPHIDQEAAQNVGLAIAPSKSARVTDGTLRWMCLPMLDLGDDVSSGESWARSHTPARRQVMPRK